MAATARNFAANAGKPSFSAVTAKPSYISVHSWFSPSAAADRFSAVDPIPFSSLNHSFACSFSLSAVFRNRSAICSNPSFFACEAKYVYLFLACDSPAKAASRFFSVCVPAYGFFFGFSGSIFTNLEAGCLQTGHLKSSGKGPSCTYPQTEHFQTSIGVSSFWGVVVSLNETDASSCSTASMGKPGSSLRDKKSSSRRRVFPLCGSIYPDSLSRSSAMIRLDFRIASASGPGSPLASSSCSALLPTS